MARSTLEEQMEEMTRSTKRFILDSIAQEYAFGLTPYERYIMSPDWKPRVPFIYREEK